MQIERDIKVVNGYDFESICIGDVFEYKSTFYMKTATSSHNGLNAVDILTGDLFKFSDDTEVIFHKAKVIIED